MPAHISDFLAQPVVGAGNASIISLLLQASPIVQLVLLLLAGLSIASWGVIFLKSQTFRRAAQETEEIQQQLRTGSLADLRDTAEGLQDAPEARLVRQAFDAWTRAGAAVAGPQDLEMVQNILSRTARLEVLRLERYLTLLATIGSASPFIGLFGTVWGIMSTFRALGLTGSTSITVVAPGIAEALIATAVGLAAAIPAVMAYNHYVRRVRIVVSHMESFSSEFMERLQRGR